MRPLQENELCAALKQYAAEIAVAYRVSTRVGSAQKEDGGLCGEQCPILSGAISGNQHVKYPYLGEILDVTAQVFVIISATGCAFAME
jgi:hypothetical protein